MSVTRPRCCSLPRHRQTLLHRADLLLKVPGVSSTTRDQPNAFIDSVYARALVDDHNDRPAVHHLPGGYDDNPRRRYT